MKYQEAKPISKSDAEAILSGSDQWAIREALVSLALTETDWRWVQENCLAQLGSDHWDTRAVAATCLGHIARIHRMLDFDQVLPALYGLREDARTLPYANDALADIDHYMGLPR